MALGETQIVSETRQFLVSNGVALDSFSQVSWFLCGTQFVDLCGQVSLRMAVVSANFSLDTMSR